MVTVLLKGERLSDHSVITDQRFGMSREYVNSKTDHFRQEINSSWDPSVSSSKGSREIPSNSRDHPKAEGESIKRYQSSKHNSHHQHDYHHLHRSRDTSDLKRKFHQSNSDEVEDVWTEHISSKGRVYYYNQRTEKSQWTKPIKGAIKRLKEDEPSMTKSANQMRDKCSPAKVSILPKSTNNRSSREATPSKGVLQRSSTCSTPTAKASSFVMKRENRKSSSSSEVLSPVPKSVSNPEVSSSLGGSTESSKPFSPLTLQVQDLHPLQQALLLQSHFTQIPSDPTSADDDAVSMDMSPINSPEEPCVQATIDDPRLASNLRSSTENEVVTTSHEIEHVDSDVPGPSSNMRLSPSLPYNPIADLPAHLREPLGPKLPGDLSKHSLAEFWLTPTYEMLEKQIHLSGSEYLFRAVSSSSQLSYHLIRGNTKRVSASLASHAKDLRLKTLQEVQKSIEQNK